MTGLSSQLGSLLALLLLAGPALPSTQDVESLFQQGVEALERGRDDEALTAFKRVLAADPSHEEAYQLFQSTEHQVWLAILVKEGDFALVAQRLMGLAAVGRMERRDDAETIRALLRKIWSDDTVERRAALNQLSAEHGEFAVPYMIPALADPSNDDRRVLTMDSLTRMSNDVVLPLIEALDSTDPYLRRNVALVLGYIGDPRARGMLSALARFDPDGTVQKAAQQALDRMGGAGQGTLAAFLEAGEAFHYRRDSAMTGHLQSSVVWRWTGTSLEATPVPPAIYNDELAKKSYYRALAVDPISLAARAGIARSFLSEIAELDALIEAGVDVEDVRERIRRGSIAVRLAGAEALDLALASSLVENDQTSAIALARVLGEVASSPTPGLRAALATGGALRTEAALSLAQLSMISGAPASSETVAALGEAVSREVVRMALVVDGNAARGASIAEAMEAAGVATTALDRGAEALMLSHRLPGMDAVLVSESLPDLTTSQVLNELRSDPRFVETAFYVVADDADRAAEIFDDAVDGIVTGTEDLGKVTEALSGAPSGERGVALDLAVRSARGLLGLAFAGTDLTPAIGGLTTVLDGHRSDDVAVPGMRALGLAGGPAQVESLVNVAADEDRSVAARTAAANALARIVGRGASQVSGEALIVLQQVLESPARLQVRKAVAQALGNLDLAPALRVELLQQARGVVAVEE